MSIKDKRIIVTGGARGIGEAVVRTLVMEGAQVASLDVTEESGRRVVDESNKTGPGHADFYRCDISRRADVEAAFAAATDALGGLDGLVNVAAIVRISAPEDLTDESWDRVLAVNLTGTFLTNQVAFRYLRENGGRILNFGSDAALVSYPDASDYSASKGGVISWSRTVAAAWGRHGINVNTIVPLIRTPMAEEHQAMMSAEELKSHNAMLAQSVPIDGAMGNPMRDLAPVVVFLLSEGARFISGQIISVNGGINGTR